jgi:tetratricopeptide (TPR) repeat protein
MRTLILVIAVLAVTPAATARTALGELEVSLGSGVQVDADLCPLWGSWRVHARYADAQAPARLQALEHDSLRSVHVAGSPDGGLLITFTLTEDVLWAEAEMDAVGILTVRLSGDPDAGTSRTTLESMDTAIEGRSKAVGSLDRGYMPLGEGSPWSFVTFPLVPPIDGPFVPVQGVATAAGAVPGLEPTEGLQRGLAVRSEAAKHGGSWWNAAAEEFMLAVAALGDDPTHEGALSLTGEALYLAGANDEAEYYFERVLSAFPESPRRGLYLLGKGLAQQGMGRHAQALADLELAARALPRSEQGPPLAAVIGSLASMNRWDAAYEMTRTLNRGWPGTAIDPWLEAELSYRAEDAEYTIELLEGLEKMDDSRRPLVLVRLADCAWLTDDATALSFWLASALGSGDPVADVMVRLRKLERRLIDDNFAAEDDLSYPTMIAQLRALAEVEPRAALEVALAEARYLYANEMYLDACRLDRETLRLHPEFPAARAIEARMCGGASVLMAVAHDSDDALREAGLYLEFVDRREAGACMEPGLVGRGVDVLESLGLWDEARRSLSVMMVHKDLDPQLREELVLRLARVYLASDRVADGLRTVDYYRETRASEALEAEAEALELQLILARNGEGDAAEVLERVDPLLSRPLDPALEISVRRTEGRAAIHQHEWAAAADALARARDLTSDDDTLQDGVLLGWAALRAERSEQSIAVLESLAPERLAPQARAARLYCLTRAYRDVGRTAEAEAMLAEVAGDPGNGAWADLALHESTDLDWERRFEALVSVPGAELGVATSEDETPSEL